MSYSTPDPPGQRGYPTLRPAQSRRSGDRLPRSLTQQGHNSPNTGNQRNEAGQKL